MTRRRDDLSLDGVPVTRLESDHLRLDVAPSVGGGWSASSTTSGHEFLWRNRACPCGAKRPAVNTTQLPWRHRRTVAERPPELIDGVACPTTVNSGRRRSPFRVRIAQVVRAGNPWASPHPPPDTLARRTGRGWGEGRSGRLAFRRFMPTADVGPVRRSASDRLHYERELSLRADRRNWTSPTGSRTGQAGRAHSCGSSMPRSPCRPGHHRLPARRAQVVDLAWSRYRTLEPFDWPILQDQAVNLVRRDGTVDFFYLFDLRAGRMAWRRPGAGLEFAYEFDPQVFRFAWLFASYGGFNRHYTVVLEPCTRCRCR